MFPTCFRSMLLKFLLLFAIASAESIVLDLRSKFQDCYVISWPKNQEKTDLESEIQRLVRKEQAAKAEADKYHEKHIELGRQILMMSNPQFMDSHNDSNTVSHFGKDTQTCKYKL